MAADKSLHEYLRKSGKGKLRAEPPLMLHWANRRRRASPWRTGRSGIETVGSSVRTPETSPAQTLTAASEAHAKACSSLDLRATALHSDERSGLAVVPGPGKASPVWSGSSRANGAAASTAGFQPAPGPPRARRGSQRHNAGGGPNGELVLVTEAIKLPSDRWNVGLRPSARRPYSQYLQPK
jgi:hypothetical protein